MQLSGPEAFQAEGRGSKQPKVEASGSPCGWSHVNLRRSGGGVPRRPW